MIRLFSTHPNSVGETNLQHMGSALTFAGKLMAATLCCLVHAVLPFLFVKTGSRIVSELHDRMVANRMRQDGAAST